MDFTLAKFLNSGQRCGCPNRLYVQRPIVDEFANLLKENVTRLRMGHGLAEGVQVGRVALAGWKQSGIGREGGWLGIEAFLEIKFFPHGLCYDTSVSHCSQTT